MDSVHVCVLCRYHSEDRFYEGKRGGRILFEKLESRINAAKLRLEVKPVECLSACKNFCTLAFTGKRKMTMVFGRLDVASDPDATAEALLQYAQAYSEKADGFILRADRPPLLQDKLIARAPAAGDGLSS